jgi:hypothetical protein
LVNLIVAACGARDMLSYSFPHRDVGRVEKKVQELPACNSPIAIGDEVVDEKAVDGCTELAQHTLTGDHPQRLKFFGHPRFASIEPPLTLQPRPPFFSRANVPSS